MRVRVVRVTCEARLRGLAVGMVLEAQRTTLMLSHPGGGYRRGPVVYRVVVDGYPLSLLEADVQALTETEEG